MKTMCRELVGAALVLCVAFVGTPARAQDDEPPPETPPEEEPPPPETPPPETPPTPPPQQPTEPVPVPPPGNRLPNQAQPPGQPPQPTEREEVISTMPTWEAYGAPGAETIEETFYRLSRDFQSVSELSSRRLGAVPIWPRGEVKFGRLHVLPFLREAIEYDSNFWRDSREFPIHSDGIDAAWTHVNEAGLFADMGLAGGRAKISSSLDAIWNARYEDDIPSTWEGTGELAGSYRFPSSLYVTAGLGYERREDPGDYSTSRFARSDQKLFLNAGWDKDVFFGTRARYEFGASTRRVRAEDSDFELVDRDETTFYGKLSYPVWRNTTRIFGLYQYRIDDRKDPRFQDGSHGNFNVGMEGSIPIATGESRGIRGSVSLGFDTALYGQDRSSTTGAFSSDRNRRSTNLTVNADLQYIISSKSTADLRYVRTTQFSFGGRYEVVDRVEFTFSHDFARTLSGRIQGFAEHSDPAGTDRANINTEGIGVGFRYACNEWMDIDASVDVENRNWVSAGSYRNYRGVLGATFYLNALTPRDRTAPVR